MRDRGIGIVVDIRHQPLPPPPPPRVKYRGTRRIEGWVGPRASLDASEEYLFILSYPEPRIIHTNAGSLLQLVSSTQYY
jgi:hypothetical protein